MKYKSYPPIGVKTNRFMIYEPQEIDQEANYHHDDGILTPVKGAVSEHIFEKAKVTFPPSGHNSFDACTDFNEYRRNSLRGRRRSHALQLAANYRNQPVVVFEKWFDSDQLQSYKHIIDKLRAFCQGSRVTFTSNRRGPYYYQICKPVMESLNRDLELVRKRTLQLNPDRPEDIMEPPVWGDTKLSDLFEGVYSRNDWEILATSFRLEAESYLLAMVYLGYDFSPYETDEDDDDDLDEDEITPLIQKPLSPSVLSILEKSMNMERPSVHFEPQATSAEVKWSPMVTAIEPLHDQGSHSAHEADSHPAEGLGELEPQDNVDSPSLPTVQGSNADEPEEYFNEQRDSSLDPSIFQTVDQTISARSTRSPPHHEMFAPLEPVGTQNIIPDYQTEQMDRIYQAPPTSMEPVIPGTGTENFNALFRPNRYATDAEQAPPASSIETPGPARSGYSSGVFYPSTLPDPSFISTYDSSQNVVHSTPARNVSSMTTPTGSTYPKGNRPPSHPPNPPGNGNHPPVPPGGGRPPYPPGPPSGGRPPYPTGPPGRGPLGSGPPGGGPPGGGPPGPPGGNGGHPMGPYNHHPGGNRGYPMQGPPGGGPPGPPNPPSGGATNPQDDKSRKEFIFAGPNKVVHTTETHFDTKLKPEIIPTWDGNDTSILRWIIQVDELAQRSASVFKGLGDIVPTRFRDKASAWWFSLPPEHRQRVSLNWDTLKKEIRAYWMNQVWIEKTQIRASEAKYREVGHTTETPTEYVIRKLELMNFVYNYTPSQSMAQILSKAPKMWSTVVNPRHFSDLASFQTAVKYQEDLLIDLGNRERSLRSSSRPYSQSRSYRVDSKPRNKSSNQQANKSKNNKSVRSYAVGWNNPKPDYPHPRDDSTVSKGKTPSDYGARGCLFCGSTKHWDRDCKYNKGNALKKARVMFTECSPDDMHAEAEYERCYLESQEDSQSEYDQENPSEVEVDQEASDTPEEVEESNHSDF
jgi:lysozyme family protein